MQKFLTPKLEDTFAHITLDYTYKYARHFADRVKRAVASTSDESHYEILLDLMNKEVIPYDGEAQFYLLKQDMYKGANRLTILGDMILHNIKASKTYEYYRVVFYCPFALTEYQQLRLRLWCEYFALKNVELEISYQGNNIKNEEVDVFLEERQIFNDEYMQSLTLKYPDYKE